MVNFSWTEDLCTDNQLIDGDHRKLIAMVNALYDSMTNPLYDSMTKGQANAIVSEVLNNLLVYASMNFDREEAEMQRIRYAASIAHKFEHTQLLKRVQELKATLDAGTRINVIKLSSLLNDWVRSHILKVDMQLAAALQQHQKMQAAGFGGFLFLRGV